MGMAGGGSELAVPSHGSGGECVPRRGSALCRKVTAGGRGHGANPCLANLSQQPQEAKPTWQSPPALPGHCQPCSPFGHGWAWCIPHGRARGGMPESQTHLQVLFHL